MQSLPTLIYTDAIPHEFRDTTDALAVTRDELAAAEDQWLRLEMLREEIEGIESKA